MNRPAWLANEPAWRRFVFSPSGNPQLPLQVESVGCNPNQERINRPEGYPCYHWLQTEAGEGVLSYGQGSFTLARGSGVLLPPGIPHTYESMGDSKWATFYLTFGGEAAGAILSAFGIRESNFFRWEKDSPLACFIGEMIENIGTGPDLFGLEASVNAYRFLGLLSKFGQVSNSSVTRNMEKLAPLLRWMEINYSNADIGLNDLAHVLDVSGRHLSQLFQNTFDLSPYAYLVQMRIHKAKEKLAADSMQTVAEIAHHTGFRDASHFIATFRKHTGMTPQQFRRLH
ncbi:AraC family transcriptional regulator [Paenibacillus motobuensis]|uniref:AraC family transcriptional regulator n=1 Tax=Paenibacillus TaxID=44249 RepID=UPI002040B860|nr:MULTISPECIES: AraC family transcriptional regulator [Paenibacillus]MCM3040673.1 AraC family transcriptional regulator [Paenibacillus lutimineralis]MCM3647777.1 AraC family transcriptional regulator [Paenibacillus motobuensis]